MAAWLESLPFLDALALVAGVFVGLTLLSLAAGYSAQRALQQRGRAVFDVPLKRGQTRHEVLGNVLFHAMWIPSAAFALSAGWIHFEAGIGRELLTFAGSVWGFQAFYWFLHRAMHWRPLFFIHRWHHDSLVTTPLTGFSMSPLEGVGWIVGFLGPAVIGTWLGGAGLWGYLTFLGIAWYGNIVGHANAEMMPAITSTKWGSRLFSNPITYHCLHHARFDRHYGFATAWMDAIFGTQWEDWIAASERVRAGQPLTKLRERVDGEIAEGDGSTDLEPRLDSAAGKLDEEGMRHLLIGLVALGVVGCDDPAPTTPAEPPSPESLPTPEAFAEEHGAFADYWHQGVAELTRYRLRQARYGEVYDGEAVLIFVTEPFLPDAQVKHEHGEHPEAIGVLKLNAYRRFYTGIYPYSLLTSTFSPEAGGPALKVSSSVQEWCGHAYTQINRRDGHLEVRGHSYFQDEGDVDRELPEAAFEDALYATIRRDPGALPIGPTELVPALHHLRFVHREVRAYGAEGTLDEVDDERFGGRVRRYTVRYPELERTVRIYFGLEAPRAILGWEEDGAAGRTEAVRTNAVLTDYWAHHGPGDGAYREALGLTR